MHTGSMLADVNWLAVLSATVAAFALGGLWYSKAMFGNAWVDEIGLSEETITDARVVPIFVATFVLQLIAATGLAVYLGSGSGWLAGLESGLMISLLWIATSFGINYLFERRTLRLYLINAGYNLLSFSVMGLIIGAWS